ncbi:hypothetical protein LTR94_037388, partial [Friedmanniomyces endolithicus]
SPAATAARRRCRRPPTSKSNGRAMRSTPASRPAAPGPRAVPSCSSGCRSSRACRTPTAAGPSATPRP